jgi:tetratricopeptide (TPR) repeat protein
MKLRAEQASLGTRNAQALRHYYAADELRRDAIRVLDQAERIPAYLRPVEPASEAALRLLDDADAQVTAALAEDPGWRDPVLLRARLSGSRAHALRNSPDVAEDRIAAAFDIGMAQVQELLARDSADAEALWLRGWLEARKSAYLLVGLSTEQQVELRAHAVSDYGRALEIDPKLAPAAEGLAELFYTTGSFHMAHAWAERALDLDQFRLEAREIMYQLAITTFEIGEDSLALSRCHQLLDRWGERPQHNSCVLEVLAFGDLPPDVPEAWHQLERIRYLKPPGEGDVLPYYELEVASVLARAGLRDSTHHVLERVRQRYPEEFRTNSYMLRLEAAARFRLAEPAETDSATQLLRAYMSLFTSVQDMRLNRRDIAPYLGNLYPDRPER